MSRANRPARLNRGLLGVLGVVALAAGIAGLVIRAGRISAVRASASVLPNQDSPRTWVYYVIAAAAIVLGLLCLRWLLAQLAIKPRARAWQLEHDTSRGHTEVSSGVAVAPFTEEVTAYPGVRAVRATLTGTHRDPALTLTINAAADADLTGIRGQLAAEGLPRLRQSLDLGTLPVSVEFRVPGASRTG
ncbi:MAG TPA: hypothetical protein VGH27_13025 [Streptosporangiaceae bacterium]